VKLFSGPVMVCQASWAGAAPAKAKSTVPSSAESRPDPRDVIATTLFFRRRRSAAE
jgi:hypothetical protein